MSSGGLFSTSGARLDFSSSAAPPAAPAPPAIPVHKSPFQFLALQTDEGENCQSPANPAAPGAPLNAAGLGENPSAPAVSIDFSEFESEISEFDRQRRADVQAAIELQQEQIRAEKSAIAALPAQVGFSLQFHSSVVESYSKRHGLVQKTKTPVPHRQAARKARAHVKALERSDKLEGRGKAKSMREMRKNKDKAKY